MNPTTQSLNKLIDHTLLKPDATREQITQHCEEAKQYGFASVAIHGCWVAVAAELLKGSGVKVDVTAGFPFGTNTTMVKIFEADQAIEAGAGEVDMVMNVGAAKTGLWDFVRSDIAGVLGACRRNKRKPVPLKVILETALLTDDEKRRVCEICKELGVDFVKTSTGFNGGGAAVEDIRLMKSVVGDKVAVKASGGIRTRATALAMLEAGATRIGTSAGITIVTDTGASSGNY